MEAKRVDRRNVGVLARLQRAACVPLTQPLSSPTPTVS